MNGLSAEAVQHRLNLALRQWRQWQCSIAPSRQPTLVSSLAGGVSNHSFLVATDQHRYVVRIDGIKTNRHGLNRAAEWQILHSAFQAGVAAEPCYFNPEIGVLACCYLPTDPHAAVQPRALAALLQQIHNLPARHYRLDLGERINRYEGQLRRDAGIVLDVVYRKVVDDCLLRAPQQVEHTLCHNDLIPANLLVCNGQLIALDWEYSAMGNPWFDIAGAALGQALMPGEDAELLGHYLGTSPSGEQHLWLQQQRVLCRYLELVWYLVETPAENSHAVLDARLPLLELEIAAL